MKNFIKSVLILCACLYGISASAQPKWDTRTNSYFKYIYTLPHDFYEMEEIDPGVTCYRYGDGIEITTYGQYNYGLWNKYCEYLEDNPCLKIFKDNWFVVSKDNGDGTEYYVRCGTYQTYIEGEYSDVVATFIINYPKYAKKRAQQIIQKCFKGFPQHF